MSLVLQGLLHTHLPGVQPLTIMAVDGLRRGRPGGGRESEREEVRSQEGGVRREEEKEEDGYLSAGFSEIPRSPVRNLLLISSTLK